MKPSRLLSTMERLMQQPTAPFHEHAVRSEILSVLSGFSSVEVHTDGFGNVLARYAGQLASPPLVFCAHMDHPAYVGENFLGGVPKSYLDTRHPVRNFGAFSMWDLPEFELRDGRVYSRACDDLVGCAVMLSMLEILEHSSTQTPVSVLFTRAEEIGLLGAVYAARSGMFPAGTTFISLETSAERPPAEMHKGVIVRVGDKTSVFDSQLVAGFTALAQAKGIPFQRCLMPGGTCEATAFRLYGHKAAGLCVALGNYHNCAASGFIDSEYVAFADVEAMLELCLAAATDGVDGSDSDEALQQRLELGFEREAEKYKALI
jgi:putative aminopeptidase FrvX